MIKNILMRSQEISAQAAAWTIDNIAFISRVVGVLAICFGYYVIREELRAPLPVVSSNITLAMPGTPVPPEAAEPTPTSLPAFIAALMIECGGGKHSEAKRILLSRQIERAAETHLAGNNRHTFVALLCLETRMGSVVNAVSHAGAKGIAQLMPATAKAEAIRCGYGEIRDEDLMDTEVNLNVAACHYAKLVQDLGPAIAPIAYNGGSNSSSVKALQRLTPPTNLESAAYSATVAVIMARFLTENKK